MIEKTTIIINEIVIVVI